MLTVAYGEHAEVLINLSQTSLGRTDTVCALEKLEPPVITEAQTSAADWDNSGGVYLENTLRASMRLFLNI